MIHGTILPEVVIYNIINSILSVLRKDLEESKEEESILYRLLGLDENGEKLRMNNYSFYRQARKILQEPDNFKVNYGYSPEVAKNLNLHILLPSEQSKNGIGFDQGYVVNDNGEETQNYLVSVYDSTYQIMITGNNSSEVNLAYNILKSMFTMLYDQFELNGLRLPSFSGNDIVMQDELVPVPMFHKVINISFTYELIVPERLRYDIISKFNAASVQIGS